MGKTEENKSLSQTQFSNPFGTGEIVEQFEPTWVKLDKQVSFAPPAPPAAVIFLSNRTLSTILTVDFLSFCQPSQLPTSYNGQDAPHLFMPIIL
jgi:hypothetical protein